MRSYHKFLNLCFLICNSIDTDKSKCKIKFEKMKYQSAFSLYIERFIQFNKMTCISIYQFIFSWLNFYHFL